jgi:hypothetical protein
MNLAKSRVITNA